MTQVFLLDTCAALWIVEDSLPKNTWAALTDAHNRGQNTYVSPITGWEIGQLARKGRFRSSMSPSRWFERLMTAPRMVLAQMPPEVLIASHPNCPISQSAIPPIALSPPLRENMALRWSQETGRC